MKSWTESQIFFVFDVDYCQTEEDDPKDAIVYFYPKNVTSDFLCDLCLQLMGVARFTHSCFAVANLIKLQRGKFALKTIGGYILVLKGSADMPDNVLQRQLQNIASIFVFYHGSFESVLESVGQIRERFLVEIEPILHICLLVSQCDGDTLSLTFNTLPNSGISKTSGTLFLRAFHILQSCQKQLGVFAGCVVCKSKVLHSLLPSSLLKKMVGIKLPTSTLPGVPVETDFPLPTGVQLRQVQVTEEEFLKMSMSSTRTRLTGTGARSGRHQCRVTKDPEDHFPLEKIEESSVGDSNAFRNPHFRVIVDESVTPEPVFSKRGNLYLSNINRDFLHSNYGHSECVSSDSGVMPSPTNLTAEEFNFNRDVANLNLLENEGRRYNPRKVFKRRHSDTDVADANGITCVTNRAHREPSELWAKWRSTNSLSDSDSERDSCSYVSSCSSIASLHQDAGLAGKMAPIKSVGSSCNVSEVMQRWHEVQSDDGSCANCSTTPSATGTSSTEMMGCPFGPQDSMRPMCLYAHYYSDTAIMLLMDLEAAADHDIITNLWKMGLASIADLETDVAELKETTIGQVLSTSKKYLYLQYDSVKKWLTGDLPEADSQNFMELVFSCNAQLSHEDFMCHRDIKEMTMWSVDHVIYSHRNGTRETFYQQEIKRGGGMPEAARSFPLGHEVLSKVAVKAKAALERDYRISLR